MGSGVDELNRRAWARRRTVDMFAQLQAWSEDAGEAAVIARVTEEVRGQPILDIGIGGGRTVPLLRELSSDYVGIDYTPEMVEVAAKRFPEARIEWGDARDLSAYEAGSFGLVFFSANGIDAVPHDDWRRVLREARRVLRPGGVFAFCTHNLDHRNAGRSPWDPRQRWPRDPRRVARRFLRLPRAIRGYLRNRGLAVRGDGWAMLNTPLYDFGLVIHYVSLPVAVRELVDAGFAPDIEVYDMFGERVPADEPPTHTKWFHLVARAAEPTSGEAMVPDLLARTQPVSAQP